MEEGTENTNKQAPVCLTSVLAIVRDLTHLLILMRCDPKPALGAEKYRKGKEKREKAHSSPIFRRNGKECFGQFVSR